MGAQLPAARFCKPTRVPPPPPTRNVLRANPTPRTLQSARTLATRCESPSVGRKGSTPLAALESSAVALTSQWKLAPYSDLDKENAMTMVTGLFKDKVSAELAFLSVVDMGYDKSDVNVVMSNEVRQRYFFAHKPTTDHSDTTDLEEKVAAADINNPANNTWGGPVGGTVGTLAPVVGAVGVLLIPGFGIVAGPLAIAATQPSTGWKSSFTNTQ